MEYRFLDREPETLKSMAQLPVDSVIAVALRASGYDEESDDIVELAIVDLQGATLFHRLVKPQNAGDWRACDASGGLAPADVEDAPELYEFEDEISGIFEGAGTVVCQHLDYTRSMIEGAWITLPAFAGFDVLEQFRLSHCTSENDREPATIASLEGIKSYYGLETPSSDAPPAKTGGALDEARELASAYRALVAEHVRERDAKPPEFWEQHEAEKARQEAERARLDVATQAREKRFTQMNGLLWLVGTIMFTSAIIQSAQNNIDVSLIVIFAAAAIFCLVRAIMCFKR